MTHSQQFAKQHKRQSGFALIETMIAMVVLTIGLCGVLAALQYAVNGTESAQEDLIARHKALDAMESIYAARNSQQIPFSEIANVSQGGIFLDGVQPLKCPGIDGLVGTANVVSCTSQDNGAACPGGVECLYLPGDDGVLGAGDYRILSLSNFTRQIAFSSVFQSNGQPNPNLRAVTITVSYTKPNFPTRNYILNALVSSYH